MLKKNYPALIIAAAVGFIMLLPQLFLIADLGNQYQGIAITEIDNDDFYYSRIKDAYDGKLLISSPRIYNPDRVPAAIPGFGEFLVALVAHIVQVSVGTMAVVGSFLFPAILYLVLFFFTRTVTGRPLLALLAPATIILASNIAFFPAELIKLFTEPAALTPSAYLRPIHPQISSILFFSFLWAWYLAWDRHQWRYTIASGVLFGALFYTYLYAWTFAVVFLGLHVLLLLIKREYQRALQMAAIVAIGALVSIGYWWNYLSVASLPSYSELTKRFGFYDSRKPFFSTFLLLDAVLISLCAFFRKWSGRAITLCLTLVLTSVIVINQQVVSGIRFFPGHYHWYYIVPISTLIILWAVYEWLASWRPRALLTIFLVGAALVAGVNGIVSQYQYYLRERPAYADAQRYTAVYQWINENVEPGAVVLVHEGKLADKLTVFTSVYSYLPHRTDRQYVIAQSYFRHTYFTKLYLDGDRDPENAVRADDYTLMYTLFGYYNLYRYDCYACFSEPELQQLKDDYREYLQNDFNANLKKYKVNYALWDTKSGTGWNLDEYHFMQFITEINGVRIYQVS
ncbi:MAG: hypothetical protein A3J59_02360 [Candidatus Buchananbacteria bacterium RIFCSPHIGHO2_02_FULL_56_16]|uniref:Glycosyltransferase RgtA/B/C/D-like domain-containing protein n=1 Tax=Candidatus Buchananbacteria bacterium RIFCSPHIGHO2_02_FULL_56_16 TaxID=1797542 RepID=A0A1G1YHV9_9BACT|nr:MAG: hypothetical protein A3J59_02360 [Candidatus Buchananbacteria bacterium RIFCSPHIGHO2_02_FULL_56_16]